MRNYDIFSISKQQAKKYRHNKKQEYLILKNKRLKIQEQQEATKAKETERLRINKILWLEKDKVDNPERYILRSLRSRFYETCRGAYHSKTIIKLLGCSIIQLKRHLESQFETGMNWQNHNSKGWHIDHVLPCASFNLLDTVEQGKCFHYTNLQPLWATDNLSKGSRLDWTKDLLCPRHSENIVRTQSEHSEKKVISVYFGGLYNGS